MKRQSNLPYVTSRSRVQRDFVQDDAMSGIKVPLTLHHVVMVREALDHGRRFLVPPGSPAKTVKTFQELQERLSHAADILRKLPPKVH